ncbi:Aminodeoxychorismate synthase component 1 [Mannheimia haemolytica]|uniref:Para-aminobenzoate synthase component 1 n=2 Tax=Mannheimia haemolytica TaxID=75985 RepID=A0A378NGR4_MANHA|nr:anthranilate synthase component I [Mannheimia haemolytica serotype A2 str. OVINE]EEY12279.1 anthranilate synthase component I [Mannheimia haemolytica serotype A2 str. BOVINE]TCS88103.1 aminodeoxychorismate synthase subunit I [Mannheimia haemolytica]STY50640.1 Para-aminobenzoate synthase component 1 [Mannheimia haemolytica]STY66976.1 Para-aminobenzoate synthase component 1 [Mannheimia haemolytica]
MIQPISAIVFSMQDFIHQANHYGQAKRPFFFLIDFEQKKPLIFPLEQAHASGLFFEFFCKSNLEKPVKKPTKAFELSANPIPFSEYQTGFELVKKEIQAGNSYLLNLSYPTAIETNYSLAEIFAASKAKYKCYLQGRFVCFSPECFVRIENNRIFSYPMKGTINANEENAEQKLMASEKEFTEHNTIVDLIRNDLALVAKNIEVTKYRYVEKVETHRGAILQTSSEICGELGENWQENIGSILAKLLPAGSISGAPKEKTVSIIQQAELGKRGYYTGIFGYFDGESLESAVAIRYIAQTSNGLVFHSGGGITSQSVLTDEYNELLEKVYVPISAI